MAPSKLLKPQALKSTDKISILTLASGVKKNIYDLGIQYLNSKGIKVNIPVDPVFNGYKFMYSPASAGKRASELHKSFSSKNIKGVFSLRGGYGSAELLPRIDFKLFRRYPKIFSGFSDVTALLINLYQKSGLICIHGPSLIVYGYKAINGNKQASDSLEMIHAFLAGQIANPFEDIKLKQLKKFSGAVKGRLIGGNLSMLCSLLGTEWAADFDNHIVFLEEVGEAPYRVHRMLLQLKQAGKFKKAKALVLGDFIDSRSQVPSDEPGYDSVVLDVFKDCRFPIYKGLPVGHGELNFPIPIGVIAELKENRLEIKEKAVIQ